MLSALAFVSGSAPAAEASWSYTVVPGDTLIGIAGEFLAEPQRWPALQKLNGVRQPRRMPVGRRLQIPLAWLHADASVATVASVSRNVERLHRDGRIEQLSSGAELRSADTVRTGADGAAVIVLPDGSRVHLAPSSRITIEQLLTYRGSGAAAVKLQLHEGRAESDVRIDAPRPRFEIKTPMINLGVRGTQFRASADGERSLAEVTRGQVQADSPGAGHSAPADAAAATRIDGGFGIVATAAGLGAPQPLLPAPDLQAVPGQVERLPLLLAWADVPGAVGWRAQLRSAKRPDELIRDGLFSQPRAGWADLPDGGYVLRVRAIDRLGLEGADAQRTFTLKARPEPPIIQAPREGGVSYGDAATWQWSRSAAVASYRLQVSPQPDFAQPFADLQGLSGPAHSMGLPPGTWYWRMASVRADADQGPWSDVQRFEQREAPPPPEVAAPDLAGDRLMLSWSRRVPGDSYQIQISRNADFTDLLVDESPGEPTLDSDKPAPGIYHLRVRTVDAGGFAGPWSAPSELEIPVSPWWWLAPALWLLLVL